MAALSSSMSQASLVSDNTNLSRSNSTYSPPSPESVGSASSSKLSLTQQDEENETITAKRAPLRKLERHTSSEDLRLLAISTHMTELSYTISDIQTRIFEIQELRHKSQAASGDDAGTTTVIDQSLMALDEKLESVSKGMKSVNDSLEPLLSSTPTVSQTDDPNPNAAILRKHTTLVSEWEAVQEESEVLREELKEDKWLTVFRTVTDQADGMMSSLEKGVNRCQEFIWQVHRRGIEDGLSRSQLSLNQRDDKSNPTFETFTSLLESFEAKKKHYMPATSKVLSIIDKGVRDRVTKNGETLRRHAESAQRWKNLKDRIARTDAEMENIRKILLQGDGAMSEGGSSTSGNGYLATPPSGSRGSSGTLSRSISPFRKFARKITGSNRSPVTPVTPLNVNKVNGSRTPSSEPTLRRQRTSIFTTIRGATPVTPDRPAHKYSQSLTPDSSPRNQRAEATIKGRSPSKQPWNSSTKVQPEDRSRTIKATPSRRAPSATGHYPDASSTGTTYKRSLSRASMASSRPWSPLTSSVSTTHSSNYPPLPSYNPPSRAQTPARAPSRAYTPGLTSSTPKPRPNTPSHIPAPSNKLLSIAGPPSDAGWDDESLGSPLNRALSPALSTTTSQSALGGHPPRPPSRSMIPIPSVQLSTPSRPGTSMSMKRSESPSTTFRSAAARAQTPESALKARAQQVGIYTGSVGRSARPSITKLPPSSFRDGAGSTSRVSSRSGSHTPWGDSLPLHEYVPSNPKDPLDAEVAIVVNSLAHGLLVERVDPPLKKIPKEGEEIKAQYSFSNALSSKVVTCKLTTLTRTGKGSSKGVMTKKVMCRVGGGWQDLSHYILNRQAGM
ncbi:hypothetical protein D9758_007845 [Tetrapyrgos nigripes]|uniref:GAR domain-containing protein n=1 Tax=Tetrapyrgos nigripes TaxID=182062 RepID=A0A8H5CYB5_9AGAR|nr:hypothetical protein D9758_007845 [Tetrapyrgos nigripes]